MSRRVVGWVKRQRNPTNPAKMLGYISFHPTYKILQNPNSGVVGWVKRQRNPTNSGKMLGYISFHPTYKISTQES